MIACASNLMRGRLLTSSNVRQKKSRLGQCLQGRLAVAWTSSDRLR